MQMVCQRSYVLTVMANPSSKREETDRSLPCVSVRVSVIDRGFSARRRVSRIVQFEKPLSPLPLVRDRASTPRVGAGAERSLAKQRTFG